MFMKEKEKKVEAGAPVKMGKMLEVIEVENFLTS
jgi:hypothetical protein